MFVQTLFTKKTLNQDINEHLSEQNLQYMLNGDLYSTGTEGSQVFIQNQLSNELNLDINVSKLCGSVKLDKNQFVLFFEPGEIGLYDSDLKTYTKWASNICLNLSLNNWVTGIYKYIKEKRWIYFIDGVNPVRYINIDEKNPGEYKNCRTCNDIPNDILDCDRIKLFKNFIIPKIKFSQIDGNLPGGNYQIAIRFTDNQIGISEYYIYSDNVKVHSNYNQRFGIKVDFECFNTDYEEYEIVLIANRADRATVGQSVGFFDVSVTSVTITELDSAKYHPIDSTNLLEIKPYYQSAKHIATNNESLILGSVKTRPPINYHPQAFKIKSKWASLKVPAKNAHKFKSYMRDEVYAHNIRWIYKDGERTNWFHIKPQVVKPLQNNIHENDIWDDCDSTIKKYWEIYNTATVDLNINTNPISLSKYKIQIYPNCIEYQFIDSYFSSINPTIEFIDCQGNKKIDTYGRFNSLTASKIISCTVQGKDKLNEIFGIKQNDLYLNPPLLNISKKYYNNIKIKYVNDLNVDKIIDFTYSNTDEIILDCAVDNSIVVINSQFEIKDKTSCSANPLPNKECELYEVKIEKEYYIECQIDANAYQTIPATTVNSTTTTGAYGFCVNYTDKTSTVKTLHIKPSDLPVTIDVLASKINDIKFYVGIATYNIVTGATTYSCTNTLLSSNVYNPSVENTMKFDKTEISYTSCNGQKETILWEPNEGVDSLPEPQIFCAEKNTVEIKLNKQNTKLIPKGSCNPSGETSFLFSKYCADYEVSQTGNFAYWESTLTYPDLPEFGEYRCQKIQYHKFPDNQISPHFITDTKGNNIFCSYVEYASILTIYFEDIEFPKDENGNFIPDIVGYEIGVNDRSGNKSILHKGLLYNMAEEQLEDCTTGFYSNYPFNDLNTDVYIGKKWTSNPGVIKTIGSDDIKGGVTKHNGIGTYRKDMFSYISPNINFVKNDQGAELILYDEIIGDIKGKFSNTDEMPKFSLPSSFYYWISSTILTGSIVAGILGSFGENATKSIFDTLRITLELLKNSIHYLQHARNYFATSNYVFRSKEKNGVVPGNKRRKIDISQFLSPTKILLNNIKINNYQREASLFIKINKQIENPTNTEITRILQTDLNNCTPLFTSCNSFIVDNNNNTISNKQIQAVSYYAGIKNYRPEQYGDIYSSNINQVTNILTRVNTDFIFGGDVYVTKHKQVKKLPFFTDIPKELNTNEYFTLSDKANVGIPRFYADHLPENDIQKTILGLAGISSIATIINLFKKDSGQPYHLDRVQTYKKQLCTALDSCMTSEFLVPQGGFGGNLALSISNWALNSGKHLLNVQGSFYTHAVGVIEYWCESEYIGNFREINNIPQSNIERTDSEIKKYDTILYPELFLYDLSFLAKNVSKVTPFHKVNSYSYNVLDNFKIPFSIKDDIESGLDNWRIFKPANYHQFTPVDGSLTTIHSINDYNLMFSFENATYITQSDDGIITNQGSSAFLGGGSIFQRRMKRISDEQTGFGGSVDKYSFCNSRFGTLWVDRLRKRIFLYDGQPRDITTGLETWLDKYLPEGKPDNYFDSVRCIFDNYTKNFYITFNNKVDKPWTVSFKPEIKSFISFHSFTPLVYFQLPNNFLSIGPEAKGIWKHNKLYSYQSYYDKFYKFDVGYVLTTRAFKKIALNNIEIGAQFFNELGFNKRQYKTDVFFNQFCVYNSHVTTGLKSIVFKDPAKGLKNVQSLDQSISEVTEVDSHIYRINGVRNYATPLYNGTLLVENTGPMDYALFNYDYNTSVTNQGKIQGKLLNVHFINTEHDMKILMHYGINNVEEVKQ